MKVLSVAAICAYSLVAVGQQLPGRVQRPGNIPISHATVRIEGAGSTQTSDSGEFSFPMTGALKVGYPVIFHVTDWVIVSPCEQINGRTYVRDPAMEPVHLIVLRRGDKQLTSTSGSNSIVECAITELVSQFKSRPRPPVDPGARQQLRTPPRAAQTSPSTTLRPVSAPPGFAWVKYEHVAADAPSVTNHREVQVDDSDRNSSLARKAQELGLTRGELQAAINAWVKSPQKHYQRGLAALYEKRYAEASNEIRNSLEAPGGDVLSHYVPLAAAEYNQDHFQAAEAALRKVLATYPNDALVLYQLAVVLSALDKYAEAETSLMRALDSEAAAPRRNVQLRARILVELSTLYCDEWRLSQAEPLLQQALALDETSLTSNDDDYAFDVAHLGHLATQKGDFGEAEKYLTKALSMFESGSGTDSEKAQSTLRAIGNLYLLQGRYADAQRVLEHVLEISERVFGPDDPRVIYALWALANVYIDCSEDQKAEALLLRALAFENQPSVSELTVSASLRELGSLYVHSGKDEQAEPLLRRALDIDERIYGRQSFAVSSDLDALGQVYGHAHREEGRKLLDEALGIQEQLFGPESYPVVATLHALAWFEGFASESSQARYLRAIAIEEQTFGPDDYRIAFELNNLGVGYFWQALKAALPQRDPKHPTPIDMIKAVETYKRALRIEEKMLGPDHVSIAETSGLLGAIYDLARKYDSAEPLYRRALAIEEKITPDSPSVQNNINMLAIACSGQKKYGEAAALYTRLIDIRTRTQGANYPHLTYDLRVLSEALRNDKRYDDAEPLLRKALALDQATPDHALMVAEDADDLAIVLRKMRRAKDAKPFERLAAEIRKSHKSDKQTPP